VELEFDQEDSVGSLLLESLTDNDDDDDDEEDEEDDEEENARLLQMATLQSENEAFQTSINKLHEDVAQLTKERNTAMQNDFKGRSCVSHDISLNDSFEDLTSSSHLTTMESNKMLRVEKDELQRTLLEIRKANEDLGKLLLKKGGELEEAKAAVAAMKKEAEYVRLQLPEEVTELRNAKGAVEERVVTLECELEAEQLAAAAKLAELTELHNAKTYAAEARVATLEGKLEAAILPNTQLTDQVSDLQNAIEDATKLLLEKEVALEEAKSTITAMKEEASSVTLQLSSEVMEPCNLEVKSTTMVPCQEKITIEETAETTQPMLDYVDNTRKADRREEECWNQC